MFLCKDTALSEDFVELLICDVVLSLSHCDDEHLVACKAVGAEGTALTGTDIFGHLVEASASDLAMG